MLYQKIRHIDVIFDTVDHEAKLEYWLCSRKRKNGECKAIRDEEYCIESRVRKLKQTPVIIPGLNDTNTK